MNNPAWMDWIAGVMEGTPRQAYASAFPPDRFYCILDELPLHLIPQCRIGSELDGGDREPLFLNPDCIICDDGELPEALASQRKLLSAFALQASMVWVPDASGGLLPFWLGPRIEDFVRGLRVGEPVPRDLHSKTLSFLHRAGILLSEGDRARTMRRRNEAVARAAEAFRKRGYAPLANLIHPFHVAVLRRYYRYLIRSGAIRLGDGQSPRRYVAHNEPVARFFHHQICATLSAVARQPLQPSYVYFASYLSGAELKKHTDREQCEFSLTLCLDFSPEPARETPWPIRLDAPSGTTTVYQAIGDGLAYRGTRLPHYRDALGEGQTSTSIFFHYVRADFAGSLD